MLASAGLTVISTYEFTAPHIWTLETLAGFAHSTSILSRSALGDHLEAFERDLRDRLLAVQPNGNFEEPVSFTYDLAVKPQRTRRRRYALCPRPFSTRSQAHIRYSGGCQEPSAGLFDTRRRRAKFDCPSHPPCSVARSPPRREVSLDIPRLAVSTVLVVKRGSTAHGTACRAARTTTKSPSS